MPHFLHIHCICGYWGRILIPDPSVLVRASLVARLRCSACGAMGHVAETRLGWGQGDDLNPMAAAYGGHDKDG